MPLCEIDGDIEDEEIRRILERQVRAGRFDYFVWATADAESGGLVWSCVCVYVIVHGV